MERAGIMSHPFSGRLQFYIVLLSVVCLLRAEAAVGQVVLGVEVPTDVPIHRVAQALRLAAYSERHLAEKLLLGEFSLPQLTLVTDQFKVTGETEVDKEVVAKLKRNDSQFFDIEAPPIPRIGLLPKVNLGFRAEFEYNVEKNFDLNTEDADDLVSYEFSFPISFSYIPTENFSFFLSLEPSRIFFEDEEGKHDDETKLELKHALLSFRDIVDGLDLKIGRQRFTDEREWLYDEELDGIRFFYAFRNFALDFSFSELRDKDLLHGDDEEQVNNIVIYGYYAPNEKNTISAYSFIRDARTNDQESPIFYGLHYHGEPFDNIYSWLELAHIRGRGEEGKIRGFGFDLGATYVFDLPFEPSLTLGYAFGSGDDDPADGRDENFRQTGLQDNSANFNGLSSVAYYGEMFDPELSNLHILTAGLGMRPTRQTSVDLVYHLYRQDVTQAYIRDAEIDEDPDGLNKDLGHEIDLIFVYSNKRKGFKASLTAGYFIPGRAFSNEADEALFTEFKLRYNF